MTLRHTHTQNVQENKRATTITIREKKVNRSEKENKLEFFGPSSVINTYSYFNIDIWNH
jgi:hypothetical protein